MIRMTTNHTTAPGPAFLPIPPAAARIGTLVGSAVALAKHLPRLDLDRRVPRRPHRHRLPRRPPGPHPHRRRTHPAAHAVRVRHPGPALAHPRRHQQPRPPPGPRHPRHHRLHHRCHRLRPRRHRQPGARRLGQRHRCPHRRRHRTRSPRRPTARRDRDHRLAALPQQPRRPQAARAKALPSWAEILVIVAAFGIGLYVFAYGIDTDYTELFIGFLITVGFAFTALHRAGLVSRLTALTTKHRNITLAAALVAAVCFPFTQQKEEYALIGANILIFGTVALGLNVVVGLAGLLDLGYVAFLGVGAYAAALVSGSTMSAIGVEFPFWAAVLTGAGASLVFGVLIGAPTLRLRGDYLAIVTLGFGEIFRLTVNNLNGNSGPDLTNGSQGIPSIPDLNFFGFDFGLKHNILGFDLGRSANYYLLMLVFTAVVVLVFRRSGESRIGRAWVAIREDETAATAMGINAFRLKLLAFALGATLAGLAGTVQAHVNYTVTPEQYQFMAPYRPTPPSSSPPSSSAAWGRSADPWSAPHSSISSRRSSSSCRTTSSSSSASRSSS